MSYKLVDIKGIGDFLAEKFAEHDITTVEQLLEAGATRKGRKELAEKTEIAESKILRFVNMADLFRIKGIAEEYSNLLELAGVDTVKELRNRVPANLHKKMEEANAEKGVVKRTPQLAEVESWVAMAKEIEPKVTY